MITFRLLCDDCTLRIPKNNLRTAIRVAFLFRRRTLIICTRMHGALIRRSHQAFTRFPWSRLSNVWCWLLQRTIRRGTCQSWISHCVLFRSQEDVQGRVAMSQCRTENAKHLAIVFPGLLPPLLNGHLVLSASFGLPSTLIGGDLLLIFHKLVHHVSVKLFYESVKNVIY